MKLPFGFSPTQAIKQAGDWAGVYGNDSQGGDYDVFGDASFAGGARDPRGGGFVGRQGTVNKGWVDNGYGGMVLGTNTSTPNTSGPGGGGQQPYVAPVDPYARWGGQANYNNQVRKFDNREGSYSDEARVALRDKANTYDQSNRDWLDTVEDTQQGLNRRGSQNALNLRTSMASIIRGIQEGIRSGNVMLAGNNAMSSGAAEAIARAYAKVGNRQTGEARSGAAMEDQEIALEQQKLGRDITNKKRDFETYKDTELGRVRTDFRTKLSDLAEQARSGGFGDVVNTGLVETVLDEAIARMAKIDAMRNQRLSGIKAWSPDQIMQEAIKMEQAGQVGNVFDVNEADVNYGGGDMPAGAPMTNLPIYLRNKDQLSVPGQFRRQD